MKIPKKTKKYCKHCKKYTEMTISLAKVMGRNKTHPLSWGSRPRMRKRGLDRGAGNQGKISRGAVSSWKRYGVKASKKTDFRYKCGVCGKMQVQRQGFRAKKVEFV